MASIVFEKQVTTKSCTCRRTGRRGSGPAPAREVPRSRCRTRRGRAHRGGQAHCVGLRSPSTGPANSRSRRPLVPPAGSASQAPRGGRGERRPRSRRARRRRGWRTALRRGSAASRPRTRRAAGRSPQRSGPRAPPDRDRRAAGNQPGRDRPKGVQLMRAEKAPGWPAAAASAIAREPAPVARAASRPNAPERE